MKKVFTLFFACVAAICGSVAQSFVFQMQGRSLEDGAMVSIAAVEDEFGFGELWCETNPSSSPSNGLLVRRLSGSANGGTATLEIVDNSLDAQTLQWCMGGACSPMNDVNSLSKNFTFANETANVMFDAVNIRSTGYLIARLTVNVGTETRTVYIEFTNGQSSSVNSQLSIVNGQWSILSTDGRMLHRGTSIPQSLPHGIYVLQQGQRKIKVFH